MQCARLLVARLVGRRAPSLARAMVRGGRGGTSNSGKAKRAPKAKAKKALGKKRGSVVKTHGGGGKAKAKVRQGRVRQAKLRYHP